MQARALETYQVLALSRGNTCEMEHKELQAISVLLRQHAERFLQVATALRIVCYVCIARVSIEIPLEEEKTGRIGRLNTHCWNP
jgi:hypothetical protein